MLLNITVLVLLRHRYLIELVKEECPKQMHQRHFITRYQSRPKKHCLCCDKSIQQGEGSSLSVSMNQVHVYYLS
jgi:hypothetical protein